MAYARPVNGAVGKFGERQSIVLTKGDTIWGERKINDRPWSPDVDDILSPVTVGGVTEVKHDDGEPTRIAVFGSASFLTNRDLRLFDHLSVFHNTMWWLVGQEELIGVRAPEDVVRDLYFDPEGSVRRMLMWTLLGIIPGCAVLLALAAYMVRRK
jgi:hypothetical protein